MNRVITSERDSDFYFPLHKIYYEILKNLLSSKSVDQDKYAILAPDCSPSHKKVEEMRKHKYVKMYIEFYRSNLHVGGVIPDVNSCEEIVTTGFSALP